MTRPNPDPHTRVGVYGLCVDDGRVLLTQLWSRDVDAGKWSLPGGGIDFGEPVLDGLHRELYEETGLTGEVEGLLDVVDRVFPTWQGWGPLHAIGIIYAVRATGEPCVVEVDGSTAAVRWVPLAEASTLRLTHLARRGLALLSAQGVE